MILSSLYSDRLLLKTIFLLEEVSDSLYGHNYCMILRRNSIIPLRHLTSGCRLFARKAATKKAPSPLLEEWDRGGRNQDTGLSPLLASMKRLIDLNPGCVSLIQVGSFYELYFEQAEEYGPKLGLKIAKKKTLNHVVPFAGFPTTQLRKFTEMLIHEQQVNVAIIDQCDQGSKTNQNLVHRKISRIITPGTLIDESFLNFNENNYLVAISFAPSSLSLPPDPQMKVGLSWTDISVGESFVQLTTLGELSSDIARINPSEILLPKEFQDHNLHLGQWYSPLQELKRYIIRYHSTTNYNELKLQYHDSIQKVRRHLETFSPREQAALNMIMSYMSINLPDVDILMTLPTRYFNETCLQMDSRTREALELTERTIAGRTSSVGSLVSVIKRTCTSSGTRLLTEWIKSPSLDIKDIEKRQSFVKMFLKNQHLKIVTRQHLQQLGDFIRNLQKLVVGRGDPVNQLVYAASTLDGLQKLRDFLVKEYEQNPQKLSCLKNLLEKFDIPKHLAEKIYNTIDIEEQTIPGEGSEEIEEPKEVVEGINLSYTNSFLEKYRSKQEGNTDAENFYSVKRDFNDELKILHDELSELEVEEHKLWSKLRNVLDDIDVKLNIGKKTVLGRYSNVILITGKTSSISKASAKLDGDILYEKKMSLVYRSTEWNDIQHLILDKKEAILLVERKIIEELKLEVTRRFPEFRELAGLADFLDVTSSLAIVAEENNWTCPKLIKTPRLSVEGGRHVVVESSLKESGNMFIPNDSKMGTDGTLWVISGPNMGGKSTYLRQNALIVILAQIGSFVPAEKATIGLVDKIFTRIGATDDLFNDLSTFMVEMVEVSNILTNATPLSLAIVDEIGRGTSGKEGLAIAYATLLSLLQVNKCRTLFATHFGKELEQLLVANNIDQKNIRYFRTRVLENGDNEKGFVIDHTLEPGISERSHALDVARMAGFPENALKAAEKVLDNL